MASSIAVGVAILFAYVVHFIFYIAATRDKLNAKPDDISERNSKLYIFGALGLLSIQFTSTFLAIFAWLAFFCLLLIYVTAAMVQEDKKKKFYNIGKLAFSVVCAIWWIGGTVIVFGL